MGRMANAECWSAEVTLAASDTTKTLLAAKTGRVPVMTHMIARILVAAAQTVDIACGTVKYKRFGASEAVGTEAFLGPMEYGLPGVSGTAIVITPAAAGPSVHVVAEGYYQP